MRPAAGVAAAAAPSLSHTSIRRARTCWAVQDRTCRPINISQLILGLDEETLEENVRSHMSSVPRLMFPREHVEETWFVVSEGKELPTPCVCTPLKLQNTHHALLFLFFFYTVPW